MTKKKKTKLLRDGNHMRHRKRVRSWRGRHQEKNEVYVKIKKRWAWVPSKHLEKELRNQIAEKIMAMKK